MNRKIVIAYEDHEHGAEALALARALAAAGSVEVVVMNVLDRYRYVWEAPLVEELTQAAEDELASTTTDWPEGVAVSTRAVAGMSAAGGIHRLAEAENAGIIVLGPTHRGTVRQAVLGTTAAQLLHGAPCPVALAPPGYTQPEAGIRTVAVAYDGSPQADSALGWAADTARALGGRLQVIAVVEPPSAAPAAGRWLIASPRTDRVALMAAYRDRMREDVDRAVAGLPAELSAAASIREGDPAAELRVASASDVDLLVVGSRGFGPVRSVLLGSVAAALALSCPVPVVFVPRPGG